MKKLLIFFSTLFVFLIPHAKAEFDPMQYFLYFNNNSTDNYLYNTLTAIKGESCTYDYCVYGGSSESVAYNLENLITYLKDNGYIFFITVGYANDSTDVSSLSNLYIDIIDVDRSSSDLFLYTGKTSSSILDFMISSELIDDYNRPTGVYSWRIGPGYFEEYDIESINEYVSTHSSNKTTLKVLSMYEVDSQIAPRGYSLYYTNLQFEFRIDPFSFKIFNDKGDFTVSNGAGYQFDKLFMLSWYVNDYSFDGDTSIPGEKPDDEDTDATNQDIVDGLGDLNDSINSTDTSGAEDSFGGFFDNFEDDDYGLSDIIKTPLTFIQGLSTNTCTPITLPLPFVDQNLVLPCIKPIFQEHFSPLLTVYQLITFGLISYFIVINIFKTVRGFKNPDSNNVEVLEL